MTLPRYSCLLLASFWTLTVAAQRDTIPRGEVERMMRVLAGDSLEGRGNFQPGLTLAARFVVNEFKAAGLLPYPGQPYLAMAFRPAGGKKNETGDELNWGGRQKPVSEFVFLHQRPGSYTPRDLSSFQVIRVEEFSADLFLKLPADTSSLLIWCSRKLGKRQRLGDLGFQVPGEGLDRDVLLVAADTLPGQILLRARESFYNNLAYNIVGILPGEGPESIMLAAHYDHEGRIPGVKGDQIMNGANDNASGSTALMTVARALSGKKFKRSLVFAAFSAEELGLIGSEDFVNKQKPTELAAVINLEMLGVPQLGPATVFITGQHDSSLPMLLGRYLKAAGLIVLEDPVPDKLLYERSDNFPFALRDIPAHTIMASTDDDPCYHQFCDELGRVDLDNLTRIINAIRVSLDPFLSGEISKREIR